jgi:AmmeMemoRadiSam system protein B
MSASVRPQLRPHLVANLEGRNGSFLLWDRLQLAKTVVRLTAQELGWVRLFNGRNSLGDVQEEASRRQGGRVVPLEAITQLAEQLEEALFLDGPRYRARLQEIAADSVRPPACLDSYEPAPAALRRQLDRLFIGQGGPGKPSAPQPDAHFRAALVPHVDYGRGGTTYAWVFKEIYEHNPASLFVIVGTSHYSRQRFTLTCKHFRTPLGVVPTDAGFIDRLVDRYGEELFEDELLAHLPEHSIELEVVLLQYLYGDRPFRIVPLVVGSFQDGIISTSEPRLLEDDGRMIEALRAAERETKEPVCYLISGGLAHLGPKFGDPLPVRAVQLARSRRQDELLLEQVRQADPAAFFRIVAEEADARRICGLPPGYTVLEALRPTSGRLLHYDQWVDPSGFESVSFAGMAFYS